MADRRLGALGALFVVAGVVLMAVGSRGLQALGLFVVVVTVVLLAGAFVPRSRYLPQFGRRIYTRTPREDDTQAEYIEQAGTPSEAVWEREQQRYRDRPSSDA